MINGDKKHGQLLATARRTKKNRLPNKRESGKARNRSASAKWGGNRGESSAHLRVKWTVDNINTLLPLPRRVGLGSGGGRISTDTFYPRVSRTVAPLFLPRPCRAGPFLLHIFSFLLSFARFRIVREYFEGNFPRRGLTGTPKEIS